MLGRRLDYIGLDGEKRTRGTRKGRKKKPAALHRTEQAPARPRDSEKRLKHETMLTSVAGKRNKRGQKKYEEETAAHQHAVVAVLVKEYHASLRRYCDLLLGHPAVVRKEDRLTAFATLGLRGEVQKERPGCLGPDRAMCRLDGNLVRVVIYGFAVIVSRGRDRLGVFWLTAGMQGNRAILGRWGHGAVDGGLPVKHRQTKAMLP